MNEDPFIARLLLEMADWTREGVIDPAAARRIRRRYGRALPDDEDEAAAGQGRTTMIIGSLGSILVGLGVILFVASNWSGIDRPWKLAVLLAGLSGFSAAAFFLRVFGHPRIGAALVFVSALVYGANIFLVGQIYHVRNTDPLYLLLWAAGCLPLAYVTTSRLSLFVAWSAVLGWYGLLLNDWRVWSGPHPLVAPAFLAFGLLFLAGAGILARFPRTVPFALITRVVGLVVTFQVVFWLTFTEIWRSAGRSLEGKADPPTAFVGSVVGLLLAALVAVLAQVLLARREKFAWVEAGGSLLLALVTLALLLVHPFSTPETYSFIFNFVALATVVWAVVLGAMTGRESWINLGLVLFGFVVMARYFDLSEKLFDRSLEFIGAGLLLLVGGFLLERFRRSLLTSSHSLAVSDAN